MLGICGHDTCSCEIEDPQTSPYCSSYCANVAKGDPLNDTGAPGAGCACHHNACDGRAARDDSPLEDPPPIAMGGGPGAS